MTKRRELSFCEFMREYCAGAWKYAIGCWLGVFAGRLLSFAGDYGEETYKKNDRQFAANMAGKLSRLPNGEQVLSALSDWSGDETDFFRKVWKQHKEIREAMQPGFAVRIETEIPSVESRLWEWAAGKGPLYFATLVLALSFLSFCLESKKRGERLADLPWRKAWVWCCVALTFPVSIPCILGSAARWREDIARTKKIEATVALERQKINKEANKGALGKKKLISDEMRNRWLALRGSYRSEALRVLIEAEQQKVDDADRNLESLGEEMGREQQNKTSALRRLVDLRGVTVAKTMTPIEAERFERELYRLCSMGRVANVAIHETEIVVITKPIIGEVGEDCYDLGDWRISFSTHVGSTQKMIQCCRTTRGDGTGEHPYSSGPWKNGQICFGADRNIQLEELQKRGEYLSMVSIIIECLPMYNKGGGEHKIIANYPKLDKAAAEAWKKQKALEAKGIEV